MVWPLRLIIQLERPPLLKERGTVKYEAVEWKRISGRIRSALCSLGVIVAVCSGSAVAAEPKQANNGPVIRVLLDETSGTITLPLEEYLRGVVPSEIGARAPDEAKKAQ